MTSAFESLKYFMIISKSNCKNDLVLVSGECKSYLQVVKNALLEIWLYFLFGNTFDKV